MCGLGIYALLHPLLAERRTRPWTLSAEALAASVAQHRRKGLAGWLRYLLTASFSLVFGRERGPRRITRQSDGDVASEMAGRQR